MSWVTTRPVTPRSRVRHHELVHDRRRHRIEARRRLVVENVARLERDRARDADPLAHPARELRGVALLGARAGPRRRGSPRTRSRDLGSSEPAPAQPEPDVLADGHRVEQRGELEDVADVARAAAVSPSRIQRRARPVHRPARSPASGCEQPDECLSATLLPDPESPMITVVSPVRHVEGEARRAPACRSKRLVRASLGDRRSSEQHQRPERVEHQDRLAAEHHRARGGAAHAFRPPRGLEARAGSP